MSLHLANSSLSPTERKQMDCGKKVFSFFKGGFLYVLCNYLRALWVHKYIIEQEYLFSFRECFIFCLLLSATIRLAVIHTSQMACIKF